MFKVVYLSSSFDLQPAVVQSSHRDNNEEIQQWRFQSLFVSITLSISPSHACLNWKKTIHELFSQTLGENGYPSIITALRYNEFMTFVENNVIFFVASCFSNWGLPPTPKPLLFIICYRRFNFQRLS